MSSSIWYDPTAKEIGYNERKSVDMFHEYAHASLQPLDEWQVAGVTSLILATIDHDYERARTASAVGMASSPVVSDRDLAFFLDIDLAILASPEPRYHQYAAEVRREYAAYGDDAYRAGRIRVLEKLLGRPKLYVSAVFEGAGMEEMARNNTRREIEHLTLADK
jgi:predicted metal-dependent HD superfamily phosphohydrolase